MNIEKCRELSNSVLRELSRGFNWGKVFRDLSNSIEVCGFNCDASYGMPHSFRNGKEMALSKELQEIADSLGDAEIQMRLDDLNQWSRIKSVVEFHADDVPMTPEVAMAFAELAKSIRDECGINVTVNGNYINRPRKRDEMIETILASEKWKRDQAAKKAEKGE